MKSIKSVALTLIVGVLCFSAGKFSSPSKIEIKEVEKIVYKESSTTKTNTDRTIDKKETIKPDGTRIIETVSSTKRTSDNKTDKDSKSETSKSSTTESRPDWHITAMYVPPMYGNGIQSYGLAIQRRIISEVYFGVYTTTQKTIGISLGIGF